MLAFTLTNVLALAAPISAPIIGGTPATTDGAIVALHLGDGGQPVCTGTLIAPDRVLTAAHCVFPPGGSLVPPHRIAVVTAGGGATYDVRWAATAPGFDRRALADDVAVLGLATAVAGVTPVAPLAPGEATLAAGTVTRWVGFGFDQPGASGTYGVRHSIVTALSSVDGERLVSSPVSCNGDSGGAVLVDTGAGEVLAGVISAGGPACSLYSKAARVDGHAAWIAEVAAAPGGCARDGVCWRGCEAGADPDCLCPADGTCQSCLLPGVVDPDCAAAGEVCRRSDSCLDSICVAGVCRDSCAEADTCGAAETCTADEDHGPVCLPTSGGCDASSPTTPWSLLVSLGLLGWLRRGTSRRPRPRRTP